MRGVGDDTLVTATEAASLMPVVSKHLIGMWRLNGHIEAKGRSGRSPLYRWGDLKTVEARMARAAVARNNPRARRSVRLAA